MRWRTYTVLMPSDNATAVDITVESMTGTVGAASAPTAVGADGFFAEWRNRPLRCPNKFSLGAAQFVPRFRLGFILSIEAMSTNGILPQVNLSRSLVGPVPTTAAGATTNGDASLADPGNAPVIRLVNSATVGARLFRVHLGVAGPDDEDNRHAG